MMTFLHSGGPEGYTRIPRRTERTWRRGEILFTASFRRFGRDRTANSNGRTTTLDHLGLAEAVGVESCGLLGRARVGLDRALGAWAMSLPRWFSRGGARASSSGDPPPFSGGVSRRSVAERRVAGLRRQTEASSAAARRVAESALDVAAATLEELEHQTESLGQTARRLDDAAEHVTRGEEALEELHSCCPFFSNTSRPPHRARSRDTSTRLPFDRVDRPGATRSRVRRDDAARPEPAHLTRVGSDDVAHVSLALDALGDAGERMGEELDRQAAHVDDIARRAAHLGDRVDRANRRE